MNRGGSLILQELVTGDLKTTFSFGLLPGWWLGLFYLLPFVIYMLTNHLGTEKYREWSPHCSKEQWNILLEQNGFSTIKMEIVDNEDPMFHTFNWMVATACESTPTISHSLELTPAIITNVTIMTLDNSTEQLMVAKLLQKELMSLGSIDCDIVTLNNSPSTVKKSDQTYYISLMEFGTPLLSRLIASLFHPLKELLSHTSNIFWVKGGGDPPQLQDSPEYGSSDGFFRALRTERNDFSTVTLWLKDSAMILSDQIRTMASLFENRVLRDKLGQEVEYVQQNGLLHTGRLLPSSASNHDLLSRTKSQQFQTKSFQETPPIALNVASPGFLDSFYFIKDDTVDKALEPLEIEIKIKAVGVNFRDLLTALGRLNAHKTMGCECAGIVTRAGSESRFKPGDRVCTNQLDSFRTHCRSHDDCTQKLPDDMSFVTGASIPLVFTTAYHGLVNVARIQPGNTVLIHAGAGGVGGAAIQIAKHFDAEVFTTVGSRSKKELVMERYGIPESHIFYSRSTSFAGEILHATKGRGIDIVFNSLSGNGLLASWECVAPFGHFVEIGKRDIDAHKELPMYKFDNNVSFSTVDLAAMMRQRPELILKSFQPLMDLIRRGTLKPITPLHIYKMSELEAAFRYMQTGNNTGKIVIDVQPDDKVLVSIYSE
jgi:NADPH:quinone reductase-like Zn-dependent oxidoreductase